MLQKCGLFQQCREMTQVYVLSVSHLNIRENNVFHQASYICINSWLPSTICFTGSCYTETAAANISIFLFSKMDWTFPQVAADDLDQGQNGQVTYSIRPSSMSGLFKIDPVTGSITTAAIMDREIWTQTKWVSLFASSLSSITSDHVAPFSSSLGKCMFNVCYCDNVMVKILWFIYSHQKVETISFP